jgi:ATP-dependent Clp protease ATP-binding subunit ClpA
MIAQELEVSLHMAFVEARQQRHEFITVEHLLMALLDNPSAAEGLSSSAISRCSTVMNSWRCWRASTNAMCRLTSSSWAIMRPP